MTQLWVIVIATWAMLSSVRFSGLTGRATDNANDMKWVNAHKTDSLFSVGRILGVFGIDCRRYWINCKCVQLEPIYNWGSRGEALRFCLLVRGQRWCPLSLNIFRVKMESSHAVCCIFMQIKWWPLEWEWHQNNSVYMIKFGSYIEMKLELKQNVYFYGCLIAVEWPWTACTWLCEIGKIEQLTWDKLRSTCLMNCNDQAFTQCVDDVITTLVTSHVNNQSACDDVKMYVIVK